MKRVEIVWLLGTLAIMGCGAGPFGGNDTDRTDDRAFQGTTVATPVVYGLADPFCVDQDSVTRLSGNGAIDYFFTGQRFDFALGLNLSDKALHLELHASDQSVLTPLGECGSPSPDTVEGSAVVARGHLLQASGRYHSAASKRSVEPVSVSMFPMFRFEANISAPDETGEVRSLAVAGHMTDNASWGMVEEQEDVVRYLLSFYPKSSEMSQTAAFGGLGLWEIGFVPRHEYGHHVFYSHMRQAMADQGLTKSKFFKSAKISPGFMPASWSGRALLETQDSLIPAAGFDESLGALNEGFADVFAYGTSVDLAADSLGAYACLADTRAIDSPTFADGTAKQLTTEGLRELLSGSSDLPTSWLQDQELTCQQHSFADVHTVGAVVAHAVWRIFAAPTPEALLEFSLQWLDRLDARVGEGFLDGAELLRIAVEEAAMIAQTAGHLEACAVSRELFPVFDSDWTDCAQEAIAATP